MLDDPEQVRVFLMGMGTGWLATVLVRAMFSTGPRKREGDSPRTPKDQSAPPRPGPLRDVRPPPPAPMPNAPRPFPRTVVHVHRFEGPFGSVARDALGCMICRTCGGTPSAIEDEQTVIDDRGL